MKTIQLLGALALAAIALPNVATAQFDGAKPYVRIDGGWVTDAGGDRTLNFSSFMNDRSTGFGKMEDGGLVGIGGGVAFSSGLRADLQLTYRWGLKAKQSGTGRIDGVPSTILNYNGSATTDIDSFAMMVNGYYDIKLGSFITPYVGAGIGFSSNTAENTKVSIRETNTGDTSFSGYEKGRRQADFAWSLMAGAAIDIMPGLALDVGYRYFDGGKVKSHREYTSSAAGTVTSNSEFSQNIRLHEITAGLRYSF